MHLLHRRNTTSRLDRLFYGRPHVNGEPQIRLADDIVPFPKRESLLRQLIADQARADWYGPGVDAYDRYLADRSGSLSALIEQQGPKAARQYTARWDAVDDLDLHGLTGFTPQAWDYWVQLEIEPDATAAAGIICQWSTRGRKPTDCEYLADVNLGDAADTATVTERLETVRSEVEDRLAGPSSPQARERERLATEILRMAHQYNDERDQRIEYAQLLQRQALGPG